MGNPCKCPIFIGHIKHGEITKIHASEAASPNSRGLVHLARAHHAHPEVKAYAKPPEAVMKTMCAVMTVMEKTPSWGQAWLSGGCFLQRSMASNVWKRQE